jgi:cystathionine beta-lyase
MDVMISGFNFDTPIDRRASDSHKWRKYQDKDVIPMWVADMDFASPPAVLQALHQRVDHAIFGYAEPHPRLKEAVVEHLRQRHHWSISPEWIVWLPGLVTGLNVACRSVGRPGAGVVMTPPIYPPFFTAPRLAGKQLKTVPLAFTGSRWELDLDGPRRTAGDGSALFLLCNPHNPTGRVFSREELETLAEFCLRSNWTICADEIHCDLVLEPGRSHVPMASLSPEVAMRTITLMAPSKTFNLPGLGCAYAIISDPKLRRRFLRAMAGIVPHINLFGYVAAQAAYEHGLPWLDALLDYLRGNRQLVQQAITRMQGLHMATPEATYLAWIDARQAPFEEAARFFEQNGVGLSDGVHFGAPGYLRLNFGCPRSLLTTALNRMAEAIRACPAAKAQR